ncbi:YdeI/OmpD-associated family protein [Micromonospora mirobrigensis]|uniref:Bacteriocin-protection, YdeI or OmpD-Associated n=1 Tax=Micromonospora mirobrigensis TaxID=262898 RepID=A0A1C5AKE7_9ACTN|nr:YdeI/OmpD-associated family protein [Micromonospora mirobrigensis]SCF45687.1 Bacteriocin-protection, YdeI or OmpD-Associated [Micromonospora mirobrigensis]
MKHRFIGQVDTLPWGRNRYRVIRVPDALADNARQEHTRRVAGTIDGVPVNLALNRAPVIDGWFLWAGESLLRQLGAEPGEHLECVLGPTDPDVVDLPEDLETTLADAGVTERWESLSPPARRRWLSTVNQARRAETRARRITEIISALNRQSG